MATGSTTLRIRTADPRLGTYFGVFASLVIALVSVMLIAEQIGGRVWIIRPIMLLLPLVLVAVAGLIGATQDPLTFFAAGRRVPSVYVGAGLALSALGGTGFVCLTGLMFLNGMDTWAIGSGIILGFVVMGVMIAPFLRKFGGFTLASYLGRRFESRIVAVVAAAMFAVPMLLVLSAELSVALGAMQWLTGVSRRLLGLVVFVTLVLTVVLGGVRSLAWSQTGQAIIVLLALLVPAGIIAILAGNIPIPQFSHGPTLRTVTRLENWQSVPIPLPSPLAFDFAGTEPTAIGQRFARAFGAVGQTGYVLVSLVVMCGIAAAPWLVNRASSTPTIYDSRKSAGWAVFFAGLVLLTLSAVAVFLRVAVMEGVSGLAPQRLPEWFKVLMQAGHVAIPDGVSRITIGSITWRRDAAMFALPIAAGFPLVLQYLTIVGAIAAAMGAAAGTLVALGTMFIEDGLGGASSQPMPDQLRLTLVRAALAVTAAIGVLMATVLPVDPVKHLFWALSLSAATAFPIVALSIWWKRMNEAGALAGLLGGFVATGLAMALGEADAFPFKGLLAAVLGMPVALVAAFTVSSLTAPPSKSALEFVLAIRIPGRETIYDRDMRILRLKRRQSGGS